MDRVGRRQFLIATGAFFAAPLATQAQQAGKVYRIGFLSVQSGQNPPQAAFFDGLRELGLTIPQSLLLRADRVIE